MLMQGLHERAMLFRLISTVPKLSPSLLFYRNTEILGQVEQ